MTRIKSDPNFFFKYAKKFSICIKAIGPLLHPDTHLLTDNKTEMCTILLDQFNNVFSTPNMIICDLVSFLIIVESIKELYSNSAVGPDGFSSSLLINCS